MEVVRPTCWCRPNPTSGARRVEAAVERVIEQGLEGALRPGRVHQENQEHVGAGQQQAPGPRLRAVTVTRPFRRSAPRPRMRVLTPRAAAAYRRRTLLPSSFELRSPRVFSINLRKRVRDAPRIPYELVFHCLDSPRIPENGTAQIHHLLPHKADLIGPEPDRGFRHGSSAQ